MMMEDINSVFLKKAWDGCSCQEITKFKSVAAPMLAGIVKNCWWVASWLSPHGNE